MVLSNLSDRLKETSLKYGIVPIVLFFYILVVLHIEYTPDDTYIYAQYARHLASGNGFSFNNGTPSYGVTGPLWALLIASGAIVGIDPVVVAKSLDLVFACLALLLAYVVGIAIIHDKWYALLGAFFFSIDAWFLRWSGSGMDASLAVVLALLVVRHVHQNEYLLASILCGLLTLVRPEGGLLFAVVMADNVLNSTDRSASLRVGLVSAALFLGIVGSWLVFAALHFGQVIPNTMIAKSGIGFSFVSAWYVLKAEAAILGATQPVAVVVLIVSLLFLIRLKLPKAIMLEGISILWVVVLPLFYVLFNVQVVSRYLIPVTPFVIILALWGLKKIDEEFQWSSRRRMLILSLIAVGTILPNQFLYHRTVVPHMEGFSAGMKNALLPIAYWLRENASDEDIILTPDIGLLGYVSNKNLYDTAGLITPEVRRAFGTTEYYEAIAARKYEKVVQPTYVVDRFAQAKRLAASDMTPLMTMEFPSLSISGSDTTFYTLYRVKR
jgi:hypothetical protein